MGIIKQNFTCSHNLAVELASGQPLAIKWEFPFHLTCKKLSLKTRWYGYIHFICSLPLILC